MAEQFLTLMADLDDESQKLMGGWYDRLREAGFIGQQTPNLPFHISLASFALDKEQEAVAETKRLAEEFGPIPVHISHIGMFAGGKILFGGPDMNPPGILALHDAIEIPKTDRFPWTPHATIIMDEAETVRKALPIVTDVFRPFLGKVTKLHLCAFWPTREILTIELNGSTKKEYFFTNR